jgi:hypothetical protein
MVVDDGHRRRGIRRILTRHVSPFPSSHTIAVSLATASK